MATAARIFEERPYDAACFFHNRHPSILTGICIETQGLRGLINIKISYCDRVLQYGCCTVSAANGFAKRGHSTSCASSQTSNLQDNIVTDMHL